MHNKPGFLLATVKSQVEGKEALVIRKALSERMDIAFIRSSVAKRRRPCHQLLVGGTDAGGISCDSTV
jgi:hypothetical protein